MKDDTPQIYENGNIWQKKAYRHLSNYLEFGKKIRDFGKSKNNTVYKHILRSKDASINFITPSIYVDTKIRISKHKLGDENRLLTNSASSQAYCFNLIIYLQQHKTLANKLFSKLMNKEVQIVHIVPEFTPNLAKIKGFEQTIKDESLGDQNLKLGIGTDADIAVFYTYNNDKKGVLIIEFKFIEAEFSVCSSYKSKNKTRKSIIRNICNSKIYYNEFIVNKKKDEKNRYFCGYNKYFNWDLTDKSEVFDNNKIKQFGSCPFINGLNQLWRNFLLAERVAISRNCNEFGFWVFSPKENDKYLWKSGKIEEDFRGILNSKGNNLFKKVYLEQIFEILDEMINLDNEYWLNELKLKYKIN